MSDYQPVPVFIERLAKLDTGERARLKRCSGQTINEAREIALFYSILPNGVSQSRENIYFLIATLYAMADSTAVERDFGASLRQAQNPKNRKGLDRRVQVLLDADENQLPFRLRQAVHYLKSQQVKINWQKLLEDLLRWSSESRSVQRRWARSYFAD
jgi:CRISPR system Cascade subunit CasB